MIIVTGASQNHFKSLQQLISTFIQLYANDRKCDELMIVYDLGIKPSKWKKLQKLTSKITNIQYKRFEFEKYPDYFNMEIGAGQYAWKPVIVYETMLSADPSEKYIIWMDAGNKIVRSFDYLCEYLNNHHIHTHVTNGPIKEWTHPKTIEYMYAQEFIECRNRNGACIAFNISTSWVRDLITDWKSMALIKDCIAPEGSDRSNHRQDQAVFTILYYFYKKQYNFSDDLRFMHPYICHQDCD